MLQQNGKYPDESRLLETWARKHQDALLRYFKRRISSAEEAQDLVQEVFVRIARRANLENIERAESYLFRVAASVVADHFRKQANVSLVSYDETRHGEAGFSPERVLSGKQALDQLFDALGELPQRTRQIFVLYHLEQMKQKEIAERLRMPLSTLEKHMARANRYLLKRLERAR